MCGQKIPVTIVTISGTNFLALRSLDGKFFARLGWDKSPDGKHVCLYAYPELARAQAKFFDFFIWNIWELDGLRSDEST